MSDTHTGPDGKTYATCRCKDCGIECHGMSGEYLERELCPKCYAIKERDEQNQKAKDGQ